MSSMVQVLDVGCPLHFLARKDLQIFQEMKTQERWGLLLSSLTIAIFWCNNLLVLAQNPFIQAKPEKISYVLILWLSNAISQCLPVTHKATPPWCCENLQQQLNTCAEDTLQQTPLKGLLSRFLVWHCPIWYFEIATWGGGWGTDMHCLLVSLMGAELQAPVGGWFTPGWWLELTRQHLDTMPARWEVTLVAWLKPL